MDKETIIVGLLSAVTAVAIAVLAGTKKVIDEYASMLIARIRKRRYSRGLFGLAEFMFAFESLCDLACIERYMLMEGKDSGGLPEAGKPYTARCLYGGTKIKERQDPSKIYGFDLEIDGAYVSMLNVIVNQGYVRLVCQTMEPCLLKRYYTAEGVAEVVVGLVGIVDNRLLYVSLGKYTGSFADTEITAIGLGLQRLRAQLNK
jgi:hypothetical protein